MDKQVERSIMIMLPQWGAPIQPRSRACCLLTNPNALYRNTQMTVTAAPRSSHAFLIYTSLPCLAQEILMTSHNDVMFIWSIFQWENHHTCALKPSLFICKYTSIHIGIPCYYKCSEPHRLLSNFISVPVTLFPRYFSAPSYQSIVY